jgi:hypothetical protein
MTQQQHAHPDGDSVPGSAVDVLGEFFGIDLGDQRLNRRLLSIVEALQRSPRRGLTEALGDPAKVEGAYRLLENDDVNPEDIHCPHRRKTYARAVQAGSVLAIHDTTTFQFSGNVVEGLGVVDPSSKGGFYFHMSLLVGPTGEPLGVARGYAWRRTGTVQGKVNPSQQQYNPDRESLRWHEAVHDVNDEILRMSFEQSAAVPDVIHVMDREADTIELLADLQEHDSHFVIRAKNNRRLEPGREATDQRLFEAIAAEPVQLQRVVQLVRRKVSGTLRGGVSNPKRKAGRKREEMRSWTETRQAQLEIRAKQLRIFASNGGHAHVPEEGLLLSVVHVQETDAPDSVEPVCWYLVSSLPIESQTDIERIIDIYRQRWLIEEYFKALKSGCAYEDHQFEHASRYLRMLAIYLPMAFDMLRLRWFARLQPDAPPTTVLTEPQLAALTAHQHRKGRPLAPKPTAGDVFDAIALLGGHLPHNGPPGWQILARGMAILNDITEGWLAAMEWQRHHPPPNANQPRRIDTRT